MKGGYRPNAGRPRKAKAIVAADIAETEAKSEAEVLAEMKACGLSPLEYALSVMRGADVEVERRDRMCIALLPYLHTRKADRKPSKRDEVAAAAEKAAKSFFAPPDPPPFLRKN